MVRLRRVPEYVQASLAPEFTEWTEAWQENAAAIAAVPAASVDDLAWADVILLGGPGRFGMIAAPLKHFIELAWPLNARGGLQGKVMASFTSTGAPHGGQEATILSLNSVFYHWGGIIVPPGVTDEIMTAPSNGNPYGVSSVSGSTGGSGPAGGERHRGQPRRPRVPDPPHDRRRRRAAPGPPAADR